MDAAMPFVEFQRLELLTRSAAICLAWEAGMRSSETSGSVAILDSITKLTDEHSGGVVIAGSHGGLYPALLAANAGLRGVVLSDAGIGLEEAGVGGLRFLETLGFPAAAVDYRSARIGDGADLNRRGIVSRVNAPAAALGCRVGEPARHCATKMLAGQPFRRGVRIASEGRQLLRKEEPRIWGLDSISLVAPENAGAIVVSGSHGALLGGVAASAVGAEVFAAAFNDAGIGIDGAGVSRLPALDARRIAGVTVSAASARIGDAVSSWETGVISACNETAASLGAREGMMLSAFLKALGRPAFTGTA